MSFLYTFKKKSIFWEYFWYIFLIERRIEHDQVLKCSQPFWWLGFRFPTDVFSKHLSFVHKPTWFYGCVSRTIMCIFSIHKRNVGTYDFPDPLFFLRDLARYIDIEYRDYIVDNMFSPICLYERLPLRVTPNASRDDIYYEIY